MYGGGQGYGGQGYGAGGQQGGYDYSAYQQQAAAYGYGTDPNAQAQAAAGYGTDPSTQAYYAALYGQQGYGAAAAGYGAGYGAQAGGGYGAGAGRGGGYGAGAGQGYGGRGYGFGGGGGRGGGMMGGRGRGMGVEGVRDPQGKIPTPSCNLAAPDDPEVVGVQEFHYGVYYNEGPIPPTAAAALEDEFNDPALFADKKPAAPEGAAEQQQNQEVPETGKKSVFVAVEPCKFSLFHFVILPRRPGVKTLKDLQALPAEEREQLLADMISVGNAIADKYSDVNQACEYLKRNAGRFKFGGASIRWGGEAEIVAFQNVFGAPEGATTTAEGVLIDQSMQQQQHQTGGAEGATTTEGGGNSNSNPTTNANNTSVYPNVATRPGMGHGIVSFRMSIMSQPLHRSGTALGLHLMSIDNMYCDVSQWNGCAKQWLFVRPAQVPTWRPDARTDYGEDWMKTQAECKRFQCCCPGCGFTGADLGQTRKHWLYTETCLQAQLKYKQKVVQW